MTLTLGHFLTLGAMLFALSVVGIFLNRKNLIGLAILVLLFRNKSSINAEDLNTLKG